MCVTRNYHQNYFELDAAAYIIGISVKNWVRECLLSVDGGYMGSIMLWFAFGFIMSDHKRHEDEHDRAKKRVS